jgi:hypothetical protein
MTSKIGSLGKIVLVSLGVALLPACQNSDPAPLPPASTNTVSVFEPGVPGGVHTNVVKVTALVTAIDYKKRTVTLKNDKGETRTLTVGPEATNFNQVKKGDHVTVAVAEELAIYMRAKNAPKNDGAASLVAKAPPGEKPAVVLANTVEMTATVKSVDLANHTATLQFADGTTRTIAVRSDVVLDKKQVGQQVVFRMTSAMALAVEEM